MGGTVSKAVSSVFGRKKPAVDTPGTVANLIAKTVDPDGRQRRFKAATGRNLFASTNRGGGFNRGLGHTSIDVDEESLG